ncbi:MAG: phage tail tape measure protein [Ilumatobacter sp.]|nr:phage tail tape measure protein [Ilumatobacter sp.]
MSEKGFTVRLSARVDQYVAAMEQAKKATQSMSDESSRNMVKVGTQMQQVGGQLTRKVTLPIAALGAAAIASAVSWESAWAGVTKTVDGTAAQLDDLQSGLRNMAKELPASHQQIAAVASAAGQLGVQVDSIESFTRTMIDLGETTNLTAEEAATAFAQFANVMGTAPDDVDNLGAALVDLGNNSATTERDILMMAQRIGGAGRIVGLTESDVLGLAAALSSTGIEVEAGGTAVSKVMTDMAKAVATGSAELDLFAQVSGQSAQDFAAAFNADPTSAIIAFVEGLGRIDSAGGDVFTTLDLLGQSDVRVSRALLSLANSGDLLTDSIDRSSQAFEENTALAAEAEKRYETTASRMKIAWNRAVDVFIDLGAVSLPILNAVVTAGEGIVDTFASLPQPVQVAAAGFLALVAAVGPAMSVVGGLIKNVQTLRAGLTAINTAATGAAGSLGMLGALALGAAAAYAVYQSLASSAKEVASRAREVAAGLDSATDAALRNASASDGARIANVALANALTGTGDDGKKLTEALGTLGLSADDVIDVFGRLALLDNVELDFEKYQGATDFFEGLISSSSEFADLAPGLAGGIAAAIAQGDDLGMIYAHIEKLAGPLTDSQKRLIAAMEELQDQGEKTDLDAMVRGFLATDAASGDLQESLLRQAEAETGLTRTGDDLIPLYEAYLALLKENETALSETAGATDGAAAAVLGLADDTDVAVTTLDDLKSAVSDATTPFDELAGAASTLKKALDAVFGGPRDLEEAAQAWEEGIDNLSESLKENGRTLDISTDKGRKNRDAVRDQVDTIGDLIVAMTRQGMSMEDATAWGLAYRDSLIEQMTQAGLTREEAEAYLATLGLTPENVETAVELAHDEQAKQRVEDLLDQMEDIPSDIATDIKALIDSGQFDEAERRIRGLQSLAGAGAVVPVVTRTGPGVRLPGGVQLSADGRYVDGPIMSVIGEAGAEVVLPLTRPGRMASLVNDPRVRPAVLAALTGGIRMFADGGIISSRIINAGGQQGSLKPGDMMAAKFEMGEIGASEYKRFLESQLGALAKYSSEYMGVWRQIQQIDDDTASAMADQQSEQDRLQRAMFETGAISATAYETYLQQRMNSFEVYSAEWMAAWGELIQVQEDQQAKADEAIAKSFDRARARAALAEAERDLADAIVAATEAGKKADEVNKDKKATDEDRARAAKTYAAAQDRVAEAAFAGAQARAAANGLQSGTFDWANFIRSEAGRWMESQSPEVQARMRELLIGIPRGMQATRHARPMAEGGLLRARPGGHLIRAAEAGQDEWLVPASKTEAFARMMLGAGTSSSTGVSVGSITVGSRDDLAAVRDQLDSMAWRARVLSRS